MDEIRIKINRRPEKGWTGDYTIELNKLVKPITIGNLIEAELEWGYKNNITAIILARIVGFDIDLSGFPNITVKCVIQSVIDSNVYEDDTFNEESLIPLENDLVYIFIDNIIRVLDESDDWLSKEEIQEFMVNYFKKK